MKTPNTQKRNNKLFEIAESQNGLFTAKQAEEIGFLPTNFQYHVKTGAWIRMERGIYRLKNFPNSYEEHYTLYSLWSRDRNDQPQGVFTQETALSIYELSDLSPSKIQMTVPLGFRKSAKTPPILRLRYADIDPANIQKKHGYSVTKPLATIIDLLHSRQTSFEFIEQAIEEGLQRGLFTQKELLSKEIPADFQSEVERIVAERLKKYKKAS